MTRFIRAVASAASIAALFIGLMFLVPGAAGAAPAQDTPVPGTECTLSQVEKAIQAKAPRVAERLNTNAEAKERFENFIVKSEAERKAIIATARADQPRLRGDHPKARAIVSEIKSTCGQY
jgi:hemophore-related protein